MGKMMKLPMYQVDAFAEAPFTGNPAAVVPLERWPDDALMQAVALENNLSETAFFVAEDDAFRIRWFTPAAEVDLCGHATLASAWVLFERLGFKEKRVSFSSRSGELIVGRKGDLLVLDFPAQPARPCPIPVGLVEALGARPAECLVNIDLMAVFDDPGRVERLKPRMNALAAMDYRGVIVTAPSRDYDFV